MKLLIVFCFCISFCSAALAQTDSIEYVHGLPVTGDPDDTVTATTTDRAPKDILVEVPVDKLPRRLRKTLEKDPEYEGWEKFNVYRDVNTGLYILPIQRGSIIRTYGLNENGKPVTFSETSKGDQ
jgi:hypothetical protein